MRGLRHCTGQLYEGSFVMVSTDAEHEATARVSPRRDCIEQSLRHPNKLRVADRMYSGSPFRTRDDIQLANRIALSVFRHNIDRTVLLLGECAETAVDDNIEAIAHIIRPPEHMSSIDLHPIQGAIDMKY